MSMSTVIYFGAFSIADRSLRRAYVRHGTEGPAKTTDTRAERPRATLDPHSPCLTIDSVALFVFILYNVTLPGRPGSPFCDDITTLSLDVNSLTNLEYDIIRGHAWAEDPSARSCAEAHTGSQNERNTILQTDYMYRLCAELGKRGAGSDWTRQSYSSYPTVRWTGASTERQRIRTGGARLYVGSLHSDSRF